MSKEVQRIFTNIASPVDPQAISAVGWCLPPDLTAPQWQECGKVLQRIDGARQWWLGDWWNAGVQWGEGEQVCTDLGFEYGTVANCGRVAKQFDFSRRREKLSFRHHTEVCSLDDPAVQDRFLAWCEETIEVTGEPRSTRALRAAIKEYLETKDWPEVDRERWRWVTELGYPTLANHRRDGQLLKWAKFAGCHVYIGRGSPWGNPFEIDQDGDRDYCIESFGTYYLPRKPSLLDALPALMGKVLECYCWPLPCHGEVLLETLKREAWELLDHLRRHVEVADEPEGDVDASR